MDRFGKWLGFGFRHLQDNWQAHIVPGLVFFGVIVGMTMLVVVLYFAGMIIGAAMGEEELGLIISMVLGTGALFVMMIIIAPLQVGYMRGTLKLMRGGELTVGDLFGGLRDAPAACIVMLVVMCSAMFAAMFCYFPAFLVAALFFHAMPSLADNGGGPIDALKDSVDKAKPVFWGLVLYVFVYGMLVGMMGYIPIVGPIAAVPVGVIFALAPYVDALDEGLIED